MSMTYDSLVDMVQSYLNRTDTDTVDQIPNFISLAQQIICTECKNIGFKIYVSGYLTQGDPFLEKPSRWRRNFIFNIGTGTGNTTLSPLLSRSDSFIRNYWPDDSQQGTPQFYGDYDYYTLIMAPTPDDAYPFEYAYLELPEPLSDSVQTNWLTLYAPQVLLYCSLLQAIPYLKNDERVPIWEKYYKEGVASLNQQNQERVEDLSSQREAY